MLPFRQHAVITDNGEAIGTTKLSVWQLSEPRSAGKGIEYEWIGEAEIESAALLVDQAGSRRLYVTDEPPETGSGSGDWPPRGKRLTVLNAIRHDYLPHVELKLQEVRGS